jgi:hypothetical protein
LKTEADTPSTAGKAAPAVRRKTVVASTFPISSYSTKKRAMFMRYSAAYLVVFSGLVVVHFWKPPSAISL